jgi:hypothetical protein
LKKEEVRVRETDVTESPPPLWEDTHLWKREAERKTWHGSENVAVEE